MNFDLKLEELAKKIKSLKKKPKLILVQVPEGLKERVFEISGFLENELGTTFLAEHGRKGRKLGTTGSPLGTTMPFSQGSNEALSSQARQSVLRNKPKVVVSAEPCFGACDLALKDAEMLKADLIVHFGHFDFGVKSKIPVIYWPLSIEFDSARLVEKIALACAEQGWKSIGLGTTIQYLQEAKKLEKTLQKKSIKATCFQVLGCNYKAAKKLEAKAEGFFYIGSGLFHALGMQFALGKKVLALHPETLELKELGAEKEKFERQRIAQISLARQAQSFAILVSTKPGQFNITNALEAKKLLEENGKKAVIFTAGQLMPEHFTGLKIDAFVNTACPRIAVDDSSLFGKPVISFEELKAAFGNRQPWSF